MPRLNLSLMGDAGVQVHFISNFLALECVTLTYISVKLDNFKGPLPYNLT